MAPRQKSSFGSKKKGGKTSSGTKNSSSLESLSGASEFAELDYAEEMLTVNIDLAIGSLGIGIGAEGISSISAGINLGVLEYETSDDFDTCTRTLTVSVAGVVVYTEQEQIEGCTPRYSPPDDPPLVPKGTFDVEEGDGEAGDFQENLEYRPPVKDPFDDPAFDECWITLWYGGASVYTTCRDLTGREWYLGHRQIDAPNKLGVFPLQPTGAAPFQRVEGVRYGWAVDYWGGQFEGYPGPYQEESKIDYYMNRPPRSWYGTNPVPLQRWWSADLKYQVDYSDAYRAYKDGQWALENLNSCDAWYEGKIAWSSYSYYRPIGYHAWSYSKLPENFPSLEELKNPGIVSPNPPPPSPVPYMDKCCQAQMSLLRQIYEVLDPPSVKKTSLPKRLFYPDGTGQEAVASYPEILKRMILQTDKNGFHPFRLKVKDTNPAKAGDQSVDLEVKSLAGALQLLLQYAIDTEGDSDAMMEILVRVAYELVIQHKILAGVDAKTENIEDFLDYEIQQVKAELPLMFNPLAGVKNGKKSALDKNTEETTESLLPELLTQTNHPIAVSRNVSKKTLTHYLLQNLQASQLNGGRAL